MDFHTLTRRELQALCKINKIPANLTNVAMANALKALEFVEGIEEIMKQSENEAANSSVESPEKSDMMSTAPRTSRRTAMRTTAKKESEVSQTAATRTRRSTRRMPPQNLDEVIETPAAPTTRRRAAATSDCSKMESLLKECVEKEQDGEQVLNEKKDLPKTPGAGLTSRRREVKEKSSVQQVYSTRRSTRLASKYEEPSKQDTEMSQSVTFDSFTDEMDEILDVNSKLSSLQLDEKQGKTAADSSAKELNVDMQQSSEECATEEITNGLIENYETVDLSAGKESNDVEGDLQQGDDLLLEGKEEVIGDNMAGEVSKCVVENAGTLCGDEIVEDDSHLKGQEGADEMALPVEFDGGDEDTIDELDTKENSECEVEKAADLLCKGIEVVGDGIVRTKQLDEVINTKEISDTDVGEEDDVHDEEIETKENSECEVEEADPLCKGIEVVGDGIILTKQLDEVINTKEISDTADVEEEEDVHDEEIDTKENYECEVEDHGMVIDNQEKKYTGVEDADMALPNHPVNEDEQFKNEGQSMNEEISEQDAPVLPLASSLPHDSAQISSGVAETDSDHTSNISGLTPAKKPSDKTPMEAATNMGGNHVVTDDKENVDNSGIKSVLTKEKVKIQKPLEDLSLRQLTKMMKGLKIQMAEKSTKATSRPALQQVSDNYLVGGESRNSTED